MPVNLSTSMATAFDIEARTQHTTRKRYYKPASSTALEMPEGGELHSKDSSSYEPQTVFIFLNVYP